MTTLLPGATSTPAAAEVNPNASSVASVARVPDCVVNVEVGIATALTVACQLPGLPLLRWVGARHFVAPNANLSGRLGRKFLRLARAPNPFDACG